jgi:DNA-binding LytR/AlgR family response regulator
MEQCTALIADDEPLMRAALKRGLAKAWPELKIIGEARNGKQAVELFEAEQPQICFLDVHMPLMNGVEAAMMLSPRAQVVFVTAFDRYALDAFEAGAIDYLLKPIEPARLDRCVARLKAKLHSVAPSPTTPGVLLSDQTALQRILQDLLSQHQRVNPPAARWLKVASGQAVKLISAGQIIYLHAQDKYTTVHWCEQDSLQQGIVRSALKVLLAQFGPEHIMQIHRAYAVALSAVDSVRKLDGDSAQLSLKGSAKTLPVSRRFLAQFKMD